MDILTHTLSGFAVGTVVASFSKKGFKERFLIIGAGGFAGALPDLDAISLWSGFDATFGQLFGLSHTGREIYSSKFWYSHHAFMHSIAAALLIIISTVTLRYSIKVKFKKIQMPQLAKSFGTNKLVYFSFFFGFLIHLLEDMSTPASSWGGVNLFWPSNAYIGGSGDIWWWNNYDIFLLVLSVLILNLLILSISWIRKNVRKLTIGVFILGCTLSVIQIKTRDTDFAYNSSTSKYNEFERKSKEIQKEILGNRLYHIMEQFDNKLNIYF